MNRRGRTIALWTAALAIVVLVAAAILAKERIREEWYLWQLRHSKEYSQGLAAKRREDKMRSDGDVGPDGPTGGNSLDMQFNWIPEAPSSDTSVKAVDGKEPLVLLSAGNDQKVKVGYVFIVYRGPEFIGEVKVIRVYQDLCGAEILFVKDGAEIRPGDKATTRI
jgi:hypothetical protein